MRLFFPRSVRGQETRVCLRHPATWLTNLPSSVRLLPSLFAFGLGVRPLGRKRPLGLFATLCPPLGLGGDTAEAQGLRRSPTDLRQDYAGAVIVNACPHRQQAWTRWSVQHVGSLAPCGARCTQQTCGLRGRWSWTYPYSLMLVYCWRCRQHWVQSFESFRYLKVVVLVGKRGSSEAFHASAWHVGNSECWWIPGWLLEC
jgi:hypothetical protein